MLLFCVIALCCLCLFDRVVVFCFVFVVVLFCIFVLVRSYVVDFVLFFVML